MITGRVLLLNFSYEPLGTIGVARAICMWFSGKLTVEEKDGENELISDLEKSRLVREDSFRRNNLTETEKNWLKTNRTKDARFWKVLSNLSVENLDYKI